MKPLNELTAMPGDDGVATGPARMETYRRDRAREPSAGVSLAVVRAWSTEDAQTTVRFATRHGIADPAPGDMARANAGTRVAKVRTGSRSRGWYVTASHGSYRHEADGMVWTPGSLRHLKRLGTRRTACGRLITDGWRTLWEEQPLDGTEICLECLAVVYRVYADEGRIQVEDREDTNVSPRGRDIAAVLRACALNTHLTVADNMMLALKVARVPTVERTKRVAEVARILDLEDLLFHKPNALSGGQLQRVAMGCALVRNRLRREISP